MTFNVKDMTKKQKLTVLALLGVLGIGGISTVVLNQPKVNTVATETLTSLTSSQLAESQEKAEQEQVLKTAQDIVSDLENNPNDENVTRAKLAIEAIADERAKNELATRIGVVETQMQQVAQANTVEETTSEKTTVQQPAQRQEQASAPVQTQPKQTQSSKTQTTQKPVVQSKQPTVSQNNTNQSASTSQKLDARKPGDAQKIVERLDAATEKASKQNHAEELKNLNLFRPKGYDPTKK